MFWFGTKVIGFYVERLLEQQKDLLQDRVVLDFPAGHGATASQLRRLGARVIAMDLFPEFFRDETIECIRADLSERIDLPDGSVDYLICQEGVEHVPNQIAMFSEFGRIVKNGGRLLVTTPNHSNLRAKLSYLLTESELYSKMMPPNEFDSIWHSKESGDIYYGHVNLIGIARLRLFALINGFRISKIHPTRVNYTALLLFPFLYPFILLSSFQARRRFRRKRLHADQNLDELLRLMISPAILLCGHLVVEFEKAHQIGRDIIGQEAASTVFSDH
ncbi:MAG: class I SAM-dependent methyltransferase [Gammaproteobacteria bacterium]|nr:class I SAM-dependent methyltransferase [Gammaproteobacteria bacterium]